jgi:hypothetical protein
MKARNKALKWLKLIIAVLCLFAFVTLLDPITRKLGIPLNRDVDASALFYTESDQVGQVEHDLKVRRRRDGRTVDGERRDGRRWTCAYALRECSLNCVIR